MKILITGGSGLLGTSLALYHANRGDQVVTVSKEATDAERWNAQDLKAAGVQSHLGTITDQPAMAVLMKGVDRVYHIAAAMREANVPDQVFWDVNVEATRSLLELACQEGVKRFVYCSSIGAMGKSMSKPANEASPCNPQDIYQVTKRAAEELCLEFQARHNFPLSIVRPADVYGPRDRRLLKLFKGVQKGRFPLFGNGKNEHHMVYVDDMTQGFVLAAEKDEAIGQIFIIAGERAVSVAELLKMVAQVLGKPEPSLRIPLAPVQAAAVVVESVCRPIGIQPPLYPRRVDFFRTDYAFDISKARQELGYQPQVDLEEGLRRTARWYAQNGLMKSFDGSSEPLATGMWSAPAFGRVTKEKQSVLPGNGSMTEGRGDMIFNEVKAPELTARIEEFDTFWEGPEDVEKGYASFGQFYKVNYLKHMPADKGARILVISCGPGYMVNLLNQNGYTNVVGIDSDPEKVKWAERKGLNCQVSKAFPFLLDTDDKFDLIFGEQEINHMTKDEIISFLRLCWSRMSEGGHLIVHSLNGANPITGAEALAQNFDHYNTFTDYSLRQVVDYSGFKSLTVIPLDLYVFYKNPFNYVAMVIAKLLSLSFRFFFILYGKHNKIFTKKIAVVARREPARG